MIDERQLESEAANLLLEAGWLLVAILTPLAVNLWARQPFELPKAALARTLTWIVAGVWLTDLWLARRPLWSELRRNPLWGPALAVAALQILSSGLSVDWRLSLWGSYERAQGLLTQLSYLFLFLVVSARLRTTEQAWRLLRAMVATGGPLVALGLAQAFGWQPVNLVTDARSPVFATLGRSNFLGAYLAMLLPLTLAWLVMSRSGWLRLAVGLLVVGELGIVALTLARGAWLAAGAAVALFGLLWFWPHLGRRARWALVVLGLLVLMGTLVGALWLGSQGGSEAARLTIWRATLELIARRPLLGYGPETLGLVFPRVYPPQLVYYQGRGVVVDRAHNLFLDTAVTTGGLGLLAWLALLALLFGVGWRAMHRLCQGPERTLLAACLAAVAGNLVGNLVSFDVTATATATWLLMGIVAGLSGQVIKGEAPFLSPLPRSQRRATSRRWAVAGLGLAGVAVAVAQFNAQPLLADVAAWTADRRAALGDWSESITAWQRAVDLWPVEPAYRLALSWACLQQALRGAHDPLPWLQQAEAGLLAARDLRPGDYHIWAALGELYGVWGNRWDVGKLPLAHDAYRQATALAPHHAMLYTNWGMVDLEEGRFAEAAAKFRQAVDLDATDGYAYLHLGDAELARGQVEAALAAYRQAVHWAPELGDAHLGVARCSWQLGQSEAAALALEQALRLDPDNPAAWALRQEMGLEP